MAGILPNFQTRHVPSISAKARMAFSIDEVAWSSHFLLDTIPGRNCCERGKNILEWEFKNTEDCEEIANGEFKEPGR